MPDSHLIPTYQRQPVAFERGEGVLLNVTAGQVIRLLPPLIIGPSEVERLIDVACQLIESAAT